MRPLPSQRYAAPANRPVVGVDDAGVGAIAGPVFAAAVLLPTNWPSIAVVDSKTLSLEARHAAFKALCATPGLVWATAAVRARQVDTMGGHPATALAMEQAVAKLEAKLRRCQFGLDSCPAPDRSLSQAPRIFCLVDGPTLPVGLEGVALPGGDRTEAAIAAGVVAAGAAGHRRRAARVAARRRAPRPTAARPTHLNPNPIPYPHSTPHPNPSQPAQPAHPRPLC